MGLLVLAGIAALVLTALALATTFIVQLVLWLSVRNTLLVVGGLAVYGFIDSRRRQVAKGFYSCKELAPNSTTTTSATDSASTAAPPAMATTPAPVTEREPPRDAQPSTKSHETESAVAAESLLATMPVPHVTRQRSFSENMTSAPLCHTADDATEDSTSAEMLRHSMSDADTDLSCLQRPTPATSTQLLPELRRKKWTKPSHSLPLKHKGESLLLRRSTSSATAMSSPRRPELYGSPRSVAMEQKLMSNALESDGYFIGDFRLPPPPLVRRTHSTGTATPPRSASPALQDRTGPRAV